LNKFRHFHRENIFLINDILDSVGFPQINSTSEFNAAEFVKSGLAFRGLNSRTIEQQLLLDYLLCCEERSVALSNPELLNNYKEN
jgi:hypothetical protein